MISTSFTVESNMQQVKQNKKDLIVKTLKDNLLTDEELTHIYTICQNAQSKSHCTVPGIISNIQSGGYYYGAN